MMKPNDEAIEAAFAAAEAHIGNTSQREWLREILTAAYAAQFQSEEYTGLIEELREDALQFDLKDTAYENTAKEAADTIETLLAKLNNKPKPSDDYAVLIERLRKNSVWGEVIEELAMVRAERDALAARLAPVEDEALVEIAAYYFTDGSSWSALSERLRNICRRDARNVIADIRPHIEAAERERCAKVAEGFSSNRDWVPGSLWGNIRNEIAAAIRSGK